MYYETILTGRIQNSIKALSKVASEKHKLIMRYEVEGDTEKLEYGLDKIGKVIMKKVPSGDITSTYSFYNINRRVKRLERKLGEESISKTLKVEDNGDIEIFVVIKEKCYSFKSTKYKEFIRLSTLFMCEKERESFEIIKRA